MFRKLQNSASVWTERDLSRLLLQAKNAYEKDELQTCNRMLEVLLAADPANTEARALKDRIHATTPAVLTWPDDDAEVASSPQEERSAPTPVATPITPLAETSKASSGSRTAKLKTLFTVVLSLIVGVTAVLVIYSQPREAASELKPLDHPRSTQVAKSTAVPLPPVEQQVVQPVVLQPIPAPQVKTPDPAAAAVVSILSAAMPKPEVKPEPRRNTPATAAPAGRTGRLSVSSRLAADIYVDDKYVGSTPTTLELPSGTQTIEYRHADLRKTVRHIITAGETTAAMINFEVIVQINARPWAQVSIEGAERQSLGQTPLSDVRVPVGATLVFENPNFTKKNYRVTGKESAIQVVFP